MDGASYTNKPTSVELMFRFHNARLLRDEQFRVGHRENKIVENCDYLCVIRVLIHQIRTNGADISASIR